MILERNFVGNKSIEELFYELILNHIDKIEEPFYDKNQANIALSTTNEKGCK